VSSCQLCGSAVSIDGNIAVCQSCGAEYDVIRHVRGRDFSKSVEKAVNAQKKATRVTFYIQDPTNTTEWTGQTLFVGQQVRLRAILEWQGLDGVWRALSGKAIYFYHKVGAGAYEEVAHSIPVAPNVFADSIYTLAVPGSHTFYAEFKGDSEYAGCSFEGHALAIDRQEFSVSPELSVNAQPALSVIVKDMIFKKPIEGARVTMDTFEAFTDALGMATFGALPPGTYTVTISARDYKSETRKVELIAIGLVVEVNLIHLGAIVLAIAGGTSVGLVVAYHALKKK